MPDPTQNTASCTKLKTRNIFSLAEVFFLQMAVPLTGERSSY